MFTKVTSHILNDDDVNSFLSLICHVCSTNDE